VIYHFWATWCTPCRAEIPTLNELQKRFGSSLKVVTIAVDENKDDIFRFFGNSSPDFQVLWDQSQTIATQWGIEKYPETFFALPSEKQLIKFSGPRDWNSPEAIDYFSRVLAQAL
jgi:thiol-disulfide isomerase/thioredoxin